MYSIYLLRPAVVGLAVLAAPVSAQVAEPGDGLFNIANDPEIAHEELYGETKGWKVYAGFTTENFAYCAAEMAKPEMTWRFGYDASPQWQLAVKHPFQGETPYGSFDVDGQSSGLSGWGDGSWVIMWPNRGEYDAIANGSLMEVHMGEVWYQMKLEGTGAAALKVQECVTNGGRAGGAAPVSAPAPLALSAPAPAAVAVMPNPAFRGESFVGNCETPYASYRCMATTLQPTGHYGKAEEITDPSGSEMGFIVQTDRADLSQVWVSYDKVNYTYLGLWGSDGRCMAPLPDQEQQVVANLGHDAWKLCIGG